MFVSVYKTDNNFESWGKNLGHLGTIVPRWKKILININTICSIEYHGKYYGYDIYRMEMSYGDGSRSESERGTIYISAQDAQRIFNIIGVSL